MSRVGLFTKLEIWEQKLKRHKSADMYKDVHRRAVHNIGNLGVETHTHMSADMYKDVQGRAVYNTGKLGAETRDTHLPTCTRMSTAMLFTISEIVRNSDTHLRRHVQGCPE